MAAQLSPAHPYLNRLSFTPTSGPLRQSRRGNAWTSRIAGISRELRAVARENPRLLQIAAINDAVLDAANVIKEMDRATLLSLCDMDLTELQIYSKMVEVYDRAQSHFLFDIVEAQVKRFLNAERLKAEAEAPARVLTYDEYKGLFLQRTQNSELIHAGPTILHLETAGGGMPDLPLGIRANL